MKHIILLLTFLCLGPLSRAQTFRYDLNVPLDASWTVTNSSVFPDGVGGGAVLVHVTAPEEFSRLAWFDAKGAMVALTDLTNRLSIIPVTVIRVTPKVLNATAGTGPLRMEKGKGIVWSASFRGPDPYYQWEVLATSAPVSDKRGFFTTQLSATNLVVRRFAFAF